MKTILPVTYLMYDIHSWPAHGWTGRHLNSEKKKRGGFWTLNWISLLTDIYISTNSFLIHLLLWTAKAWYSKAIDQGGRKYIPRNSITQFHFHQIITRRATQNEPISRAENLLTPPSLVTKSFKRWSTRVTRLIQTSHPPRLSAIIQAAYRKKGNNICQQ